MKRFIAPAIAVGAGMGVSYGLQALDVNALAAKAAGLATVGLVLLLFWRRAARA